MQKASTAIRWVSGPTTMLAGVLWATGGTTSLNADNLGIDMEGPHLALTLAGLCSLIGLAALAGHARRYGAAALTGAALTGAGVVVVVVSKNLPSSISEGSSWAVFYAGGLLMVLGSLLLGTAAVRNRAWNFGGPLLAIGVLAVVQVALLMLTEAGYVATVVLPISIGFAWIALGYALWSSGGEPVPEPQRQSELDGSETPLSTAPRP